MVRAIRFAWLSVIRQPARSLLGILGVAAIGALLFDMLLLSRGLVLSFSDLLSRTGFDVRVLASDAPPLSGPRLTAASALAKDIASLPEVDDVYRLRLRSAEVAADVGSDNAGGRAIEFIGADPRVRSMWTVVEGKDLPDVPGTASIVVVNRQLARLLGLRPGAFITASADLIAVPEDLKGMPGRYKSLTQPVGILFGTGDRILNPQTHGKALAAKLPGADLEMIEGEGHMVLICSAERSAQFIARMAQRVAGAEAKLAPVA